MLPGDILLDIFDFYRQNAIKLSKGRPWKWHNLAHVCRKWRRVISISPRRLDLRILCEYGAPFVDVLQAWPTLPLVIRYKDTKSSSLSEDSDIIVALRHPDRVWEINLGLSSSLIESIVPVIQEPFPELECFIIAVENAELPLLVQLGGSLLGGSAPHVRELRLMNIAFTFPAIREVLSSADNLVELQLSNIPHDAYFSPVDLVNGLSTLTHLKSFAIGFHSPASRPPQPPHPNIMPSRPRTISLPSLTVLDFHGAHEYLEEFVSQIDLPSLCEITIKLFNQIDFQMPHFCQFIRRLNALRSPDWVYVNHSAESVDFTLVQDHKPSSAVCCLEMSCQRLDWQLSFVTQLAEQLSPLILSGVQLLDIKKIPRSVMPTGVEDVDSGQWLELFQQFSHVTRVNVSGKQLILDIVRALVTVEGEPGENLDVEGILPDLNFLYLSGCGDSPTVVKDAKQFVSARRLAGRMIRLMNA